MNIILNNKKILMKYHYVCGYSRTTNFWGGIRKEEIEKYSSKYGLNFNIIVYDSLDSPIFYSIPFKDIRLYLNEAEGFLPHQAKQGRWQFTIDSDIMSIHGTTHRINLKEYKNNILNIPQLSFYDDFERLSEIYSENYESQSYTEGGKKVIISTKIERDRSLREEAIKIFGYRCAVCNFNFEEKYGDWGQNFIEVHHIKPLSELDGNVMNVDPKKDLIVLCANCHRMIHRKKGITLSIAELKLKLQ